MNKFDDIPLEKLHVLKAKILQMQEQFADELSHVLRYRNHEYVVPIAIEGISKFIVLHNKTLKEGVSYHLDHRTAIGTDSIDFIIDRRHEDEYFISKTLGYGAAEKLILKISKKAGLRTIEHNGITYRQIPETGDTLSHLRSQYKDIQQGNAIDLAAGAITKQDQLAIEIMHLFHDIPEKGTLEIANNYAAKEMKTEKESFTEDTIAKGIIDESPLLDDSDKSILWDIYEDQHPKDSVFKYYEFLRYFLHDNRLIYDNKEYMFNHQKIFGELTVRFIHHLLTMHRLPSGKMIRGIDFPSTNHLLKKHARWIDRAFRYTHQYCMHKMNEQGQNEYPRALADRKQIKTML